MSLDLSSYKRIETGLFCKILVPGYPTVLMSDYPIAAIVNGDNYTALGQFLSITDTSSDLRLSNQEITIVRSGIPNSELTDFMSQPIKGSMVTVVRGVFDPVSHNVIGYTGKFKGMVNTIAVNEEYEGRNQSSSITLICKSLVGMVYGRVTGEQTNPASRNQFFPNDRSMDRVPSLQNAKLNFGGV